MRCFTPAKLFQTIALIMVLSAALVWPERAWATPPKVAASIKPVQALVKMVMGSLGTPDLIIPATASPHVFSLKPSQAKMLERADLVFWIGPDLETTLKGPLEKLSQNATVVELMTVDGLDLITRTARTLPKPDEDHADDAPHDHGNSDPHIWLSPKNVIAMLSHIEATLSQIDPPNALEYAANTKKAKRRVSILIKKTQDFTADMLDTAYLVQHDAFGYLARDFGFKEVGYLQTTPGREPGAKHISGLIALVETQDAKCLFHEPQFTPKLAKLLSQEHGVSLREIDPLGADLSLSDTTYVRIIQSIVLAMHSCLAPNDTTTLQKPN